MIARPTPAPHNGSRQPIHDDPADVVAYKFLPRPFHAVNNWSQNAQFTTSLGYALHIYRGAMFRRSAVRLAVAAAKAAEPSALTLSVSKAQGISKGLTGGKLC